MRRKNLGWLAGVSALAGLMVVGQPALAKQSEEQVQINSFSGAYLAARVAEVDNDLDSAIAYYKRALAFDTENQQLQQSLMLALISQGRFDESLPYAEKLKSVPDIERFSRLALAVDAIRKKEYRSAETFLKLAQESDLDKLISGVMTAWAKAGAGDAKDALAYLEKLQGPEWFTLFTTYHRALIAEAAGNAKEADKIYSETIDNVAAGGAAPETWLRAAEAYAGFLAGRGEKDKALAVLDKADEFATGRLPLMALREKINKGDKISPLVAGPADGASEILLDLASALNRGGGEPFVRLYLQYALALKHDSDAVLLQLAAVAEQQENAEEAIELYRRVPADSSLKRAAELQLGLNLADLKRHDEAITHLKALLDQSPDDMRAYLALGGVYSSKEDYRSAADIYDKAVERLKTPDASNWNIYYQRGIAYERLKEWPKAEPNFREALKLMPNQPQVLNYLGYSWVDMNMNLEEGLDMIRKAVDLRPSDGYIVDSLGWAYYRLNRFDEAVTELERAVSLKPDDPVLNDHLGDAYWRVGRKLEATFQWSHARDMKPEPDVLATVLKKLSDGLPPLEGKTAAEAPPVTPSVPAIAPAPEAEKKSDTPAATPQSSPVEKISATPAAYKVQRGQSLWSIANEVLGNGGRYQEILNLNPQLQGDPGRIVPGQELILPGQPN
ncbi:tetratricopeptide repeat protein [Mesorhizobium sp. CGMCC 1.15528]|uniref:Tetratricopeptide repeat protein n=1 Tax=Mesorhizobium zhangyense TaxID=1776730 RepID=A0A7C9R5C9_9HYPH|nr:tetratricopeptide repeat protein [Mesorhizobium zhangyense]NGN40454.1 tetratricopeptide repeat protein [Mesorhizobium zhangyense]